MARVMRRPTKTTPRVKDGRVQRKNYRDVSTRVSGSMEIRVDVPGPGYRHVLSREQVERFLLLLPDWSDISTGLHAIVLAEGSATTDGWYDDGVLVINAWPDPMAITVGPEYHATHREIWGRLGVPSQPAPEFIAALAGCIEAGSLPDTVERKLDHYFNMVDYEIVPGADDGDWLVVGGDPADTTLAEMTQIGGEIHMYERSVLMRFNRHTAAAYQLLHVFLHELGHHVDAITVPRPGLIVRGEDYAEQWANRCASRIWDEAVAMLRHA